MPEREEYKVKFWKKVPQEVRTILSEQYQQYVKEVPMTPAERKELQAWIRSGRSPYDNGWYIATEAGIPMDFVNALRMSEDMEAMIPEYDTRSGDIVFVPNDLDEDDPFEELPF